MKKIYMKNWTLRNFLVNVTNSEKSIAIVEQIICEGRLSRFVGFKLGLLYIIANEKTSIEQV